MVSFPWTMGEGDGTFSLLNKLKLHVAGATVQLLYSGFQVLSRVAVSSGTNRVIFPAYRNALAVLLISPFAYLLEKKKRPALTFTKLFQFFICAVIGVSINQILFLEGIYYTSATFAATMQNLIPAFTFILAASLRIEAIQIRRRDGQAKVIGTLICLCGALVITVYKGPSLVNFHREILSDSSTQLEVSSNSEFKSWQLGAFCLLGNCATWAIWFVLQIPVLRNYPAEVSAMAFTFAFGTIQLVLLAACLENDLSTWAETLENDYIAIIYGGVVASGLAMTLQSWCAHEGGPVLVASYQPLQTILVAIMSSIFLGESFYTGSVVGGLLLIIGLYLVMWGKSKERKFLDLTETMKKGSEDTSSIDSSSTITEPLLGV